MDKLVGQRVKRKEDPKLITGNALYLDDMKIPGLLHASILRSPYPHANIISVICLRGAIQRIVTMRSTMDG